MSQTIFHESNQTLVHPIDSYFTISILFLLFQYLTIFRMLSHQTMYSSNGQFNNFKIGLFVMSTHIVYFAFYSLTHYQINSFTMVFYVQPIAYITTVTIYRKFLSFKNILDNQRNQFFREMIRTIVIRTTSDSNRHFIRIMVSHYHHIRTCF